MPVRAHLLDEEVKIPDLAELAFFHPPPHTSTPMDGARRNFSSWGYQNSTWRKQAQQGQYHNDTEPGKASDTARTDATEATQAARLMGLLRPITGALEALETSAIPAEIEELKENHSSEIEELKTTHSTETDDMRERH
jgi:fructose 1,6-bisphosphatase